MCVVVLVKSFNTSTWGSVLTDLLAPAVVVAVPATVTLGEKSVNAVEVDDTCGLWFSMMNSAARPTVIQLVTGDTEQSGSAFTDQHGEPVADVQLRSAPVVSFKRYVQP